jgi:hypothetical protein
MLSEKAGDSLLLGIEKFNCPFERGRVTSVLIALDHAFEMLFESLDSAMGRTDSKKRSSGNTRIRRMCSRRAQRPES